MSKEHLKPNLVVKTNRLNTALQNLSLAEIHIIQIAIVDARETGKGLSTNTPLSISALRYAEVFGTTRQTAYEMMKKAEDTLFNRRFTYFDNDGKPIKSRWIQQAKYYDGEGRIEVVFTLAVVQAITRIDGIEEFFTSYLLEQTAEMNSQYSVRLYELLIQWRTAKKTPVFELEVFRQQLGVPDDMYRKRMGDFKKRVLDLAVKEINDTSDLKVSYEQEKQGRKIVGFKFKVLEKPKSKPKIKSAEDKDKEQNFDLFTPDNFNDKQLFRITRHKKFIQKFGKLAKGDAGKNWSAFSDFFISEIKKDPEKFNENNQLMKFLEDKNKENFDYSQ